MDMNYKFSSPFSRTFFQYDDVFGYQERYAE